MDANGAPSTTGVVEIAAGTGGHSPENVVGSDPRVVTAVGDQPGAVQLSLTSTAAGFKFITASGTVVDAGTIPCQGNGTLNGTITDAYTGRPIGAATVAYSGTGPAGPISGSTITNSLGQYSVAGVPVSAYTITASAGGYSGQSATITVAGGQTATQNLSLAPNAGALSGSVTDASTSQPINGATLSYSVGSAVTNAVGQYSFASVVEGTYTVTAHMAGYSDRSASVTIPPGTSVTQNFSLAPNPGSLSGTVTDAHTSQPISANVSFSGGSTTADANGQYLFSGVAEGSYSVAATAAGYASQGATVTVGPGAAVVQNLTLTPNPATIVGTITDASTNQPISNATVSYGGPTSAATNSAGQYTLSNVTEGSYTLVVNASGYASQSKPVTVGPGATATVNAALAPNPGTVTGTVTDSGTAQPISGATVSDGATSTTTNANGLYTFSNLAEGSYAVSAVAPGYASQTVTTTVGPGATMTQNFALQPNPATINGVVTDSVTALAISGASVSASGVSGTVSTNGAGQYTLSSLAAGTYLVTVTAPGYQSQTRSVTVTAGASSTQNFVLTPNPGSIAGTVSDASTKQPLGGASVTLSGKSTPITTAADGSYSFTNVTEGSYTVSANATGYTGQSVTVSIGPGGAATQNFALQPNPGTISGTVIDGSTKQALANATVTYASSSTTTNALGQYTFSSVPEGSYTVTAAYTNYASGSQTVAVGPGAAVTQDFALQTLPATITGTVTDAGTAKPISGATVSYSGGSTTTNASGAYTLSAVPAGSYTVTATGTGYASQSATVSVTPASTVSQSFTLQPNPGTISGTITDAVTVQPITGATVSYPGGSTTTNSAGQYVLSNVAEGSYMLTASSALYASQSQSVTVGPGGTVTQNVALVPNPGTVNGTVTAASTGQPIQNATVSYAGGSATTNSAGQFTLSGVTEGTYTLTTGASGYGSQSQAVTVGPAAVVTQNFSLKVTLLFSDGFESGSFGNWTSNSGLTLETAAVHSGTYAAEGATSNGVTYAYKKLSTTYAGVYTRLYFQLKSQASGFTLVSDETGTSGPWIARLYVNGSEQLCLWDNPSPFICGPTMSLGVWHAAELHVIVNGTSSTTEVWLDGNLVSSMSSQSVNLGTTNVGAVRLGDAATGRTYDVIFDDVVVSLARIGL
jgi:hypothetical protein